MGERGAYSNYPWQLLPTKGRGSGETAVFIKHSRGETYENNKT
jgi:hypothetical protein